MEGVRFNFVGEFLGKYVYLGGGTAVNGFRKRIERIIPGERLFLSSGIKARRALLKRVETPNRSVNCGPM
jgi:hypothetical protein